MSRGNRSEAVANTLLAEKRAARVKRQTPPRWSYTADRALKHVGWVLLAAAAWAYLPGLVARWMA